MKYRIYSNKRRGAYLVFCATSAALIRGWRLNEGGSYSSKYGVQKITEGNTKKVSACFLRSSCNFETTTRACISEAH